MLKERVLISNAAISGGESRENLAIATDKTLGWHSHATPLVFSQDRSSQKWENYCLLSSVYLGYFCMLEPRFFLGGETGSCYVVQDDLNLVILLPQAPKCTTGCLAKLGAF
jgi:hypothetical protein